MYAVGGDDMTRSEIVGKNIQRYRHSVGMSQVSFAIAIGRSQTMVSMYEKGERLPSTKIILKIADVFGVHFDDIYYSPNEKQSDGYDWYDEAFSSEENYPQSKYDPEVSRKLHKVGNNLTELTNTKKWKQLSTGLQKMNESDFDRVFNMIKAAYPEYFKKGGKR